MNLRVGLAAGAARTTLLMGPERVGVEMLAVSGTFAYHPDPKKTLQFGAGSLLTGTLTLAGRPYHLGPGFTASFGYSALAVEPDGAIPFVMFTTSIAMTAAPTKISSYWAIDLRGGASVGWVLWNRFTPYATARLFGGPVFWRELVGGDQWHFQLGAGFVLGLPGGFDLTAEVVPLGEQAISAGVGYSF